jgi:hypothetical protein
MVYERKNYSFFFVYSIIIGFSLYAYCLCLLILRRVFAHFFQNDFLRHCVCDKFLFFHSLHAERLGTGEID